MTFAGAIGIMLVEPGPEQGRDLVRQADRQVEVRRARRLRPLPRRYASSSWSVICGMTGAIDDIGRNAGVAQLP